ncbi:NUD15-like protein, partial [Mya arenaria]
MSAPFDKQKRPKVGIGVLVTSTDHTGCVLVGKRKGNVAGEGMFALPVGHLEFGDYISQSAQDNFVISFVSREPRETWEECAERELLEETGLVLTGIRFVTAVNAVEKDTDYHYITLFMAGQVDLAQRREPVGNGLLGTASLTVLSSSVLLGSSERWVKTWEECTIRETKEETGLQLKNVQFYHVCNGLDLDHDYHYLELYMIGEVDETFQREPVNMEPDKCE